MDFLRNAMSSNAALLAISVVLLVVAFAIAQTGISVALTVLVAVVGLGFLVVWFLHSRTNS